MRNFLETPPNIDFLRIKKQGYILSTVLVIASLIIIFTKGFNLGLDFTGGTSIQIRFIDKVDIAELRAALRTVKLEDSLIQAIGTEGVEYEIRVSLKKGKSSEIVQKVKKALKEKFGDKFEIRKIDYIGAVVGEELRKASVYSIVAVLIAILLYVGYRFEPVFAIGAVIPLFHDAIITLGIFSLIGEEVNLSVIAAILTVLGYSLNDTIIIFDRIRENIKLRGKKNLLQLVNQSINENLSRTIITSGTTLFSVLALYLFGGESLKGFSLALLIGIIFGTYSSIYVASPLVVDLERYIRGKKTSGEKTAKAT
ncbi:preprotein translocase subunit SecF [Persephonella hydrogeniphila]|uniref:Protein-export membrane protein SecF n=1 Tax=Persephonella hydrogeniphila TaxID=198703 RepID=A0A285NFY2_9AQUI|nr:protein translocase subunit SecF [Persephonella hydrogeniphila]SNZ07877.1 preprotein translocase subunit SecF [Persephonella hydrogeniphila]